MKSIEIISIPVTDQQRAKQFYMELGFEVMVEAPFQGDALWVQMGLPGAQVPSITLVTWFDAMPPGCIDGLVIKTDDIHRDVAELHAKGIDISKPDKTPWGLFASVQDPDGNRISLHQ
ncbi:VOC family protein [Mucilaginibacter sp. dw_454]|uniref:VOC family protein n=1 Tax=Mucilaginibacter sp. dw_454 TaxID=2720079 RepID=UPI001BD4117E|nr:VOC family protein [Mucilaginibacter sp. dw_454]